MASDAVLATEAGSLHKTQGKVRDIYQLPADADRNWPDRLVLVATDRISSFDWVLPNGVPDRGKILTAVSLFWMNYLGVKDQLLSTNLSDMGPEFADRPDLFAGRSMMVRQYPIVPFECVARGYLAGSGWKEYQQSGTVCEQRLPEGLQSGSAFPQPIFTPATKATEGHDINVSVEYMAKEVGQELTEQLKNLTLGYYQRARDYAADRGLILADTKFEFGLDASQNPVLVDEILTPDSSRYWPRDGYKPGGRQPSFDKQFVRDWLEDVGFDKVSPPPAMPPDIVKRTFDKYAEAYQRLTGNAWTD